MDLGLWTHLLLIVLIVDVAAVIFYLAACIDRVLLGEPLWRFGMGSLLGAVTLVTANLALTIGILLR
jgi:hypothetical protein